MSDCMSLKQQTQYYCRLYIVHNIEPYVGFSVARWLKLWLLAWAPQLNIGTSRPWLWQNVYTAVFMYLTGAVEQNLSGTLCLCRPPWDMLVVTGSFPTHRHTPATLCITSLIWAMCLRADYWSPLINVLLHTFLAKLMQTPSVSVSLLDKNLP